MIPSVFSRSFAPSRRVPRQWCSGVGFSVIVLVGAAIAVFASERAAGQSAVANPAMSVQEVKLLGRATFGTTRYGRIGDMWQVVEFVHGRYVPIAGIGPIAAGELDAYQEAYSVWRQGRGSKPQTPAHALSYLTGLRESIVVRASDQLNFELDVSQKRILVVPTLDTMKSIATIELVQQRVQEWANRQQAPTGDEADVRSTAEMITRLSSGKLLAQTFVSTLSQKGAKVGYASDLKTFETGDYDYLLLVNIDFRGDIDRFLAAQDLSAPPGRPANAVKVFEGSLSWVLLNRSFDVVLAELHATVPFRYSVNADVELSKIYVANYVTERRQRRAVWRSGEVHTALLNLASGIRAILGAPFVYNPDWLGSCDRKYNYRDVDRIDYDSVSWALTEKGQRWRINGRGPVMCGYVDPGARNALLREEFFPDDAFISNSWASED